MPLQQHIASYANSEFANHPDKQIIIKMLDAMQAGATVTRDWFEKAKQADANGEGRDSVLGAVVKNEDLKEYGFEDVFTQADKDCENTLIPMLKAIKDIPIISEEDYEEKKKLGIDLFAQSDAQPDGAQRWLVDPIDGTFCFKQGSNDFSITLALQEKINGTWQTRIGMVAVPMHDEIFMADEDHAYLIQDDRAKRLQAKHYTVTETQGMTRHDMLKDKKVEMVVYSKINKDLNNAGYRVQENIPHAQRTYSTAMVLSKMADGWSDAVVMAANALEFPWDTDAALHIANKAGLVTNRKSIAGEPLVIVANSQPLATALDCGLKAAYAEQISQGRASA